MPGKDATSPNSGYTTTPRSAKIRQSRNLYVRTLHSAHYFAYLKGNVLITLITSPSSEVKHKHSAESCKVSLNFHLAISLT